MKIIQITATPLLKTTLQATQTRSPELWLSKARQSHLFFRIFSYHVISQMTILPGRKKATWKMHLQAEVNGRPHLSFVLKPKLAALF